MFKTYARHVKTNRPGVKYWEVRGSETGSGGKRKASGIGGTKKSEIGNEIRSCLSTIIVKQLIKEKTIFLQNLTIDHVSVNE